MHRQHAYVVGTSSTCTFTVVCFNAYGRRHYSSPKAHGGSWYLLMNICFSSSVGLSDDEFELYCIPKTLRIVRPPKDTKTKLSDEQRNCLAGGRNRCKDTYYVFNIFYVESTKLLLMYQTSPNGWTKDAQALHVCHKYLFLVVT